MLKPLKLAPFLPCEIKPQGWLKTQLLLQASGLAGQLDKIWPDVLNSRWIGGDREGWERVPYWLDGFIPLAYLLEDADMIARARKYINAILAGQKEDGWLCPCGDSERARYDVWAAFLICKVLVLYADCSGDTRVQPAVSKCLKQLLTHIQRNTLFNWGSARWFECLIPIWWLYERTGEEWLKELALKLQAEGIDWERLFENWQDQEPRNEWGYLTHVVNLAMAIKSRALMSRLTGEDPERFADKMLALLRKYHGNAMGYFSGDECLSGLSPLQGTECCGVVEAMYSYEHLLAISGNPHWGDELESLVFNALPATLLPDMTAHQYVQQTNQVQCAPLPKEHVVFRTNGPESHVFGLEPNFGCCTANFGQGFPKFALAAFMKTDSGIASVALAPASLTTVWHKVNVSITLDTLYPFRDTLTYTVKTDSPVTFDFSIRIPSSVSRATVDGREVPAGTIYIVRREWSGVTIIHVELTPRVEWIKRPNGLFSVKRGPLLYALPIRERREIVEYERDNVPRVFPFCDYYLYPDEPWAYGFAGDKVQAVEDGGFDMPFSAEHPAVYLLADMAPVAWAFENGLCAPLPLANTPAGPVEQKKLYPYGCTNLRMTEMPMIMNAKEPKE
jgi:uncharacterized protein